MTRVVFHGLLLATAAIFLALTLGLDPASRRVPLVVGVLLTALLAILLWREASGQRGAADLPGALAALAWVALLPLLIALLGMILGPGLYVLTSLRLRARTGWAPALATAALVALVLVVLFERLVHMPTARGVLLEMLGH